MGECLGGEALTGIVEDYVVVLGVELGTTLFVHNEIAEMGFGELLDLVLEGLPASRLH